MLSFFPRGVLDEILNLIESVSEGFPSYSYIIYIFALRQKGLFFNIFSLYSNISTDTSIHTTNILKAEGNYSEYFSNVNVNGTLTKKEEEKKEKKCREKDSENKSKERKNIGI